MYEATLTPKHEYKATLVAEHKYEAKLVPWAIGGGTSLSRYEYNNTGEVGYVEIAGATWYCQTFTPQITHNLTLVKLFIFTNDVGVHSPDVEVAIQNTTGDDNHPDGEDLTSATFDREELTTDEASEWKEIELSSYQVVKDTTYAIVLRMPDAEKGEVVNWWFSGNNYPRGVAGVSEDGGVTWDMEAGAEADFLFEEWGVVSYGRWRATLEPIHLYTATLNPKRKYGVTFEPEHKYIGTMKAERGYSTTFEAEHKYTSSMKASHKYTAKMEAK